MIGVSRRKVVITGASGNVGGKVARHLSLRQDLELLLIDRVAAAGMPVRLAALEVPGSWMSWFENADTVVHLAANPNIQATWAELVPDNIDATVYVLEACRHAGVRHTVFASSVQTMIGHEGRGAITPDLPPWPINLYGVSKSVGERLALATARQSGMSMICLRLGMVRSGSNPAPAGHRSLAVQQRWLSNRDLCRVVELAVDVQGVASSILNATSANAGSPWSLAETGRVLGFVPTDRHEPTGPAVSDRVMARVRQMVGWMRKHDRR